MEIFVLCLRLKLECEWREMKRRRIHRQKFKRSLVVITRSKEIQRRMAKESHQNGWSLVAIFAARTRSVTIKSSRGVVKPLFKLKKKRIWNENCPSAELYWHWLLLDTLQDASVFLLAVDILSFQSFDITWHVVIQRCELLRKLWKKTKPTSFIHEGASFEPINRVCKLNESPWNLVRRLPRYQPEKRCRGTAFFKMDLAQCPPT